MGGPAGVGRSAVAQTSAEHLKGNVHLSATFFFIVNGHNNVVDSSISKDNTLVNQEITSQLKSLIVKPLQELEKQGKRIKQKAVFIGGLDEAQMLSRSFSVWIRSTPFRWAIFTHSVELSISRGAHGEIEMYLRGEFKNIPSTPKLCATVVITAN